MRSHTSYSSWHNIPFNIYWTNYHTVKREVKFPAWWVLLSYSSLVMSDQIWEQKGFKVSEVGRHWKIWLEFCLLTVTKMSNVPLQNGMTLPFPSLLFPSLCLYYLTTRKLSPDSFRSMHTQKQSGSEAVLSWGFYLCFMDGLCFQWPSLSPDSGGSVLDAECGHSWRHLV